MKKQSDAATLEQVRNMPTSKLAQVLQNMELYRRNAAYAAAGRTHLAKRSGNASATASRMAAGMATLEQAIKEELNKRAKGGGR